MLLLPFILPPSEAAQADEGSPVKAMIKSSTQMPTGSPDMRGDCIVRRVVVERILGAARRRCEVWRLERYCKGVG